MRRSILCCVKAISGFFLFTLSILFINSTMLEYSTMDIQNTAEKLVPSLEYEIHVLTTKIFNRKILKRFADSGTNLKDWLDKEEYLKAMNRKGLGELGRPAKLNPDEIHLEQQSYRDFGYNAILSEKISLNRSVPDIRNPKCMMKKYLSQLPQVSIIMPFFDEHPSVILRSCFGILTRSPAELIKEIILVDDASTKPELGEKFEEYLHNNLPKTHLIRLHHRSGLIVARLAGAKIATSDVLIFFDAHVEPNYNWLPPLLEPIALNPRTCVCPLIDVISHETFEYSKQDDGGRGVFDWNLQYQRVPVLPEDMKDLTKPFPSPVMTGGLFAIGTDFFWEFEGYDEELDIWGGEQFELSFKIWMCGGQMLDAPCSRVAHIFRGGGRITTNPRSEDFLHKNLKRVAEAWMDEFKEYVYMREPELYSSIDPGDLSKQKRIREELHCKSFKWFMENVAFDIPKYFPLIEPPDFASGALQLASASNLCLDSLNSRRFDEVGLHLCADNLERPHYSQFWALTQHNEMRMKKVDFCLDVSSTRGNTPVFLYPCHRQGGNQYWEYDLEKQWLVHRNGRCLEANILNNKVFMNSCDVNNPRMKWLFGYANRTALSAMERNRKYAKTQGIALIGN